MYDLDELERLEKAATPAPWEGTKDFKLVYKEWDHFLWYVLEIEENINYIVALRNAAPEMIADLRLLKQYQSPDIRFPVNEDQ